MRSAFSPLAIRSTIFFGISGAPAAISLPPRSTSRALPISSSASAALAASASYSLRGRMAISPLSVFLKRTFMVLVLSIVDFPAVADRRDDDRGVILNEGHAPRQAAHHQLKRFAHRLRRTGFPIVCRSTTRVGEVLTATPPAQHWNAKLARMSDIV